MNAEFPIGSFVRYREGGPRSAKIGCVGVVANPSEEGAPRGWVRANIGSIYDDYAPEEIELARFWVLKSYSNNWNLGPYSSWNEAATALCDHIRTEIDYGENHPLNLKRDRFIEEIESSQPNERGYRFTSAIGSFVIKPAGELPPKQYDEKGRAYA
jgi:hypothetical protein